jgi:DNA polymerase-3 subunit beta
VTLPVEGFLSRVRQAKIMTDEESQRIDLAFEPGKVRLSARGATTGSSEVELPLPDFAGPPLTIAFNAEYLVEFLRALEGEPAVTLEMVDASKPAVFKCGEGYVYLVMPLAG